MFTRSVRRATGQEECTNFGGVSLDNVVQKTSAIYELAQDACLKVKFSKTSRFEKMAKLFEQIAAKMVVG
jgi:hypothetical protein